MAGWHRLHNDHQTRVGDRTERQQEQTAIHSPKETQPVVGLDDIHLSGGRRWFVGRKMYGHRNWMELAVMDLDCLLADAF